jgi:hypothetical protein
MRWNSKLIMLESCSRSYKICWHDHDIKVLRELHINDQFETITDILTEHSNFVMFFLEQYYK